MDKPLLTPQDVCKRLHISQRTFYRLLARSELKALKVGNVWRMRESALEDYLQEREKENDRLAAVS